MKSNKLYTLTAALIALYFILHTVNAMIFTPSYSDAADHVRASMEAVRFPCLGSQCTWFGFYRGLGYNVSIYLLLTAFVTFYIGRLDSDTRKRLRPVTFAIAVSFAALGVLCVLYFFAPPIILSTLIALLLLLITFRWP